MACINCPDNMSADAIQPQRAIRWHAWYIGGREFDSNLDSWGSLPDDGMLAVKVWFNDNTSRNCSGTDWYGFLLLSPDTWTIIHNNNEDNFTRYPTTLWKRGMWTSEAEMQAVNLAVARAR